MSVEVFLKNNINELIQIYIENRRSKGFGVLFLNINNDTKNMDVRFLALHEIDFSEDLYERFTKCRNENRDSIMYVTYVEQLENKDEKFHTLEIDLDTKSHKE